MDKILKWLTPILVIAVGVLVLVGGNQSVLGGSTSATWTAANLVSNGTLTVAGASTLTGAVAITGELRAPVVEKGSLTTLTATSTATVLTAAQVCDSNVIEWDVTTASSTLTLPTAAELAADCLTANGDQIEFIFDATSASTTIVTLTTGSGIELIGSASSDDLIDNGNQARVSIWRTSATTALGEVEELVAAD